jgi:alginate O-acetyltransferase complex protein AlgI
MLFSSLVFIYLFLPLTLVGYYLIKIEYKNHLLLFASLVFFAWGGVSLTIILLLSIILNYIFGLKIQKNINTNRAYWWLFAGVTVNVLALGVFKYANFIIVNINALISLSALSPIPETHILLPVGISFYTFHSLSYLVDIYRRKTLAQRNIFDLSLYVCMFSQLIAGPIIRYSDVWQQLRNRTHTWIKFSSGVERFLIGLAKKILIANTFAMVADQVFASTINDLSAINAWLGIICYSLQIYYDFSGYSDMAIGLGRMFGFEFMENFNYPYMAQSVKEFWRRWHISLSSFFRDYVYIPLGGNKVKTGRTYVNLLIVFFLTGFWHGASWTFVVWGLFHGFFMVIERLGLEKILAKTGRPVANIYTLLVVMFAWVLFRADTLSIAFDYWKALFNLNINAEQTALFMSFNTKDIYLAFVIAILGAFGFFKLAGNYIDKLLVSEKHTFGFPYFYHVSSALFYLALISICSMYLISGSYNPFIYYRF